MLYQDTLLTKVKIVLPVNAISVQGNTKYLISTFGYNKV